MATVARVAQDFKCVSGSAIAHPRTQPNPKSRESSFEVLRSVTSHEADPQVVYRKYHAV